MEMIVPQVQLQASSAHQLRNAEKIIHTWAKSEPLFSGLCCRIYKPCSSRYAGLCYELKII